MKTKGLLKGLFGLFLGLCITSSANAVTLTAGHSYALAGNILTPSGLFSLTAPGASSYFTVNLDNTISVVMNLIGGNGVIPANYTLTIDRLILGGTGTALTMNAPAGVTAFGSYKDIGNFFAVNNPSAFSNFAIAMPGQLNTAANTFKIWGAYYSQTGALVRGQTDFHLTIGSDVTSRVPEPMSMSLLGMGLLGGVINRRKKVTA